MWFFLLVILFSAEWPKTSCTGKKREKERKKGGGQTKNKEGYPLILYTVDPSLPLGLSSAAWSRICFSPVLPAGLLGEGPAVLILRCMHLRELPRPCQVYGSVGAVCPVRPLLPGGPAQSQVQGDTRRNNNSVGGQFSSSGVSCRSNYCRSQSAVAWVLRGRVVLNCTAQDCLESGASLLSCVLPTSACPKGSPGSWAVSPSALGYVACAARILVPGPGSPLHVGPPPEPPLELLLGSPWSRAPILYCSWLVVYGLLSPRAHYLC